MNKISFNFQWVLLAIFAGGMVVFTRPVPALEPESVLLQLQDRVDVSDRPIKLQDLLGSTTVAGFDDIMIGLPPSLGREIIFRRSDLDARLRQANPRGTWTWVGADQCTVSRPAVSLDEDQLKEMIMEQLKIFTKNEGQIQIKQILGYSPIAIPKTDTFVKLDLVSPNANTRYGGASLDIQYSGKSIARRNMRFEWEWNRQVWVAQTSVLRGRIRQDAFMLETRNVLELSGEPLSTDLFPPDLALVRSMSPGEPLLQSNVQSPMAVTSGSHVVASVHMGMMEVSMKAVALENGRVGQTIRVQNPLSKKEVFGRVVSDNLVEVMP